MIVIRLYKAIEKLWVRIIKIRKFYRVMVKIKNIVIKILNLAASFYSLFISIEPHLKRFTSEETRVSD